MYLFYMHFFYIGVAIWKNITDNAGLEHAVVYIKNTESFLDKQT